MPPYSKYTDFGLGRTRAISTDSVGGQWAYAEACLTAIIATHHIISFLSHRPATCRPFALKYAKDEKAFFEDYAKAHVKLSELGKLLARTLVLGLFLSCLCSSELSVGVWTLRW